MKRQERRISSASVVLYADDDHVLVVKAGYKPYWSLPGGMVDADETPRQAAVRELREETSIVIDEEALKFVFVEL